MRGTLFAGIALAALAVAGLTAREVVVHGFRVPNYSEEGVLQSQIFGETFRDIGDGYVEISGLRVETYIDGDRNRVDVLMRSPLCRYSERLRRLESDDTLFITRDNITITGRGYTYEPDEEKFTIFNESKVVISGAELDAVKETNGNDD